MNKITIMTDTNSGILPSEAVKMGIELLQMPFFVDGKEYLEYGSMDYMEFFERLTAGAEVSTSQPSPAALCEAWENALRESEAVIYLPMSSGLSGTCQTAKMLAEDYNGRVFVVDNKRISVTLKASVFDALRLRESSMSAAEIAQRLENDAMNASIYVAVNTLEYLKKGGRVTAAGAAIGSILGIKPVLQIQGEKLDAFKKVRGLPSAMQTMIDAVRADLNDRFAGQRVTICAAYSGHLSHGEEWREAVTAAFPDYEVGLDALPVSISCHVGPGALGIGICVTE